MKACEICGTYRDAHNRYLHALADRVAKLEAACPQPFNAKCDCKCCQVATAERSDGVPSWRQWWRVCSTPGCTFSTNNELREAIATLRIGDR